MQLIQVDVEGYRSIKGPLTLHVDGRVTVLLGANDHGKTNLLDAIRHLNTEDGYDPERDLNLDFAGRSDDFPSIKYTLTLSEPEQDGLKARLRQEGDLLAASAFREHWVASAIDAGSEAAAAAATASAAESELVAAENSEEHEDKSAQVATARAALESARGVAGAAEKRSDRAHELAALGTALEARSGPAISPDEMVVQAEGRLSVLRAEADRLEVERSGADTAVADALRDHGQESELAKEARERLDAAEQDWRDAQERLATAQEDFDHAESLVNILVRFDAGDFGIFPEGPAPVPEVNDPTVPARVVVGRTGLDAELLVSSAGALGPRAMNLLAPLIPRVELIESQDSIPDTVSSGSINEPDNEFMRGIFLYAGLEPSDWSDLFTQSLATTRRLDEASATLNASLREAWSQGRELEFKLDHRGDEIDLTLKDPSIEKQYVQVSRRSSGFTHFFSLKTSLYARQHERPASSYVWLFDEPGIFLHPEGQYDLLQVLETLGRSNQIVYATHSIFMLNKNYPARHRLLQKSSLGTTIDEKPFTAHWGAAIEALGLSLPGTILFASKILLTEGDSDAILIGADLQKLIELERIQFDVNVLSPISTSTSKHTDAYIRLFSESSIAPTMAALFDGDAGGRAREKKLQPLMSAKKVKSGRLLADTTIEDHVLSPKCYLEATISYVQQVADDPDKCDEIERELTESFVGRFGTNVPKGLASWAAEEGARFLDGAPSKVGIAREYSRRIALATESELIVGKMHHRAVDLAGKLEALLELEPQTLEPEQIIAA